ncbi:hypothetical protein [Streptomyces sp. MBT60]|uniref:hypothetical protein n=1 Tax=Streptomyces sp. MBT60 TaxID=2800409 RepID=UPI00190C8DE9|nr:hypothetical protein [Streptomyces sp. MBT60]MBK3546466.1 hypothetical protein [Streptomyces sp. MBT60]
MTDTTPTPADRPAEELAAALAGAAALHERFEGSTCGTCADADGQAAAWPCETASALAVARQLLGTTECAAADLKPQGHPGVDLFAALRKAGLDVDEANRRMYAYAAMVLRQEKAIAAPPAPANRAAKRNEIRDSYAETIAMAREDRDHEGAFTLECQLRDREEQWRREDDAAAASPAPADRAAVLREAADVVDKAADEHPDYYAPQGLYAAVDILRRLAADAAAGVQPPTTEAQPARRRLTPNEYDRAWHAVEGSAGEEGADPGTVLHAVLRALRIDAPTPAEEQAASPSRRATPPAAPAAPEEPQ